MVNELLNLAFFIYLKNNNKNYKIYECSKGIIIFCFIISIYFAERLIKTSYLQVNYFDSELIDGINYDKANKLIYNVDKRSLNLSSNRIFFIF